MTLKQLPYSSRVRLATVLLAAFILAACAFVYELALGAAVTQLAGSSTRGYSLSVGLFVCALGLGAYSSRWVKQPLAAKFVLLEIAAGLTGANAVSFLQWAAQWPAILYPAVLLTTAIVGSCVGLEIPILIRLVEDGRLSEQIANVLAFDYFGGLVGSLLFAWVLEPHWGLQGAVVLTGAVNLLVAVLVVCVFRPQLTRPRLTLAGVALAAALLTVTILPSVGSAATAQAGGVPKSNFAPTAQEALKRWP